jgi:hypothetical protein
MIFTQGEQRHQVAPQVALMTIPPIWRGTFLVKARDKNRSNISNLFVYFGVNRANI